MRASAFSCSLFHGANIWEITTEISLRLLLLLPLNRNIQPQFNCFSIYGRTRSRSHRTFIEVFCHLFHLCPRHIGILLQQMFEFCFLSLVPYSIRAFFFSRSLVGRSSLPWDRVVAVRIGPTESSQAPRSKRVIRGTYCPSMELPSSCDDCSHVTSGFDTVALTSPNHSCCPALMQTWSILCVPSLYWLTHRKYDKRALILPFRQSRYNKSRSSVKNFLYDLSVATSAGSGD